MPAIFFWDKTIDGGSIASNRNFSEVELHLALLKNLDCYNSLEYLLTSVYNFNKLKLMKESDKLKSPIFFEGFLVAGILFSLLEYIIGNPLDKLAFAILLVLFGIYIRLTRKK